MKPIRSTFRSAFTLVEMLVVIGIICILIAILLPVIGKVQEQARITNTKNAIASIANAIQNYYNDQKAYPGVLPNSAFTSGVANTMTPAITTTENMVLAMCGGLETGWATPTYSFDKVGSGPIIQAQNALKQKRLTPFIEPAPGQLTPARAGTGNDWGAAGQTSPPGVATPDTTVPEFMDKFQDAKPIIYMRANVGATDVVPGYPGGGTPQYEPVWMQPYMNTSQPTAAFNTTDFPSRDVYNTDGSKYSPAPSGVQSYFNHPSIPKTAKGQNAFILISAGPDGFFGTKDDIIHPGG
jgi:prepilin-type N-terminal cleavage/methylation domain-containing protein